MYSPHCAAVRRQRSPLSLLHSGAFAATAGVTIPVLLTLGSAAPAAADWYIYNTPGTQVLPTGSWDAVYNMGPGTLIINSGTTVGSGVFNQGGGAVVINGGSFGMGFSGNWAGAVFDGGYGYPAGEVDINGGVFSYGVRELGGTMNIRGGSIPGVYNEGGAPFGPWGFYGGGPVNIYGYNLATPSFLYNASDGGNVWGTYWQLGGTLQDGTPLTTQYWNVHMTDSPSGLHQFSAPEPGSLALLFLGGAAAFGASACSARKSRRQVTA